MSVSWERPEKIEINRIGTTNPLKYRIGLWDLVTILSLIVPIASLFFPDVDDSFAVLGTIIIFLSNRIYHNSKDHVMENSDEIPGTDFVKYRNELEGHILDIYIQTLKARLMADGYNAGRVEASLSVESSRLSGTVADTFNLAVKLTVMGILQKNTSPNGSYFASPYTGKKYAFIFGTTGELLDQFMHDDYRQVLHDSVPAVLESLGLAVDMQHQVFQESLPK